MTAVGVSFVQSGVAGLIRLERPQALNALTHDMALSMIERLKLWRYDPAIERIIIHAVGERAFCAGGDIRNLYDWGLADDPRARAFYRTEYELNALIKSCPKPYIALMDGIVMGGGVGISAHGSHRIGSENVTFAMPETGIGLFPDVGATWFLPRMRGKSGLFLGLTGTRLKTADSVHVGVLTHHVPASDHEALRNTLCEMGDTDQIISRFSKPTEAGALSQKEADIDHHFGQDCVENILNSLQDEGTDWSLAQAQILMAKSPTSLKITFEQLRQGRDLSFEDCMKMEFRIVSRVLEGHEFFEGVRAVIVDKDQKPQWDPSTLDKVSDDAIARYFEALGDELEIG